MADSYSQIYLQYVFAVNGGQNLLQKPWREEVFKYIAGIIAGKGQKSIIVNGAADHIHAFVALKPAMSIADLIRDIKNNSSKYINEQRWVRGEFSWQEGYGVFSYAHSQVEQVYRYIANQEEHHRRKTFKEEYQDFLQKFAVDHDPRYLFNWLDEDNP